MTKISDERLVEMLGAWRDDSRRAARGHGMNRHEMEVVSALSELQSLRQLDKEQESGHIQHGVPQSSPQPAGIRVKALEWADITSAREDSPAEPTGDIEAITLIGEYSVCFDGDDAVCDTPWCAWSPVDNIGHFTDFEEAKAAAEADYRSRVLSCLVSE